MNEDFLYYLWKYQKFSTLHLLTTSKEKVQVIHPGTHNTEKSGPDFFNAQLIIDSQKWAGNVEIHVKSSDWFLHNHQQDANYDSVILHVVWEYDTDIYRKNNTEIPTLELKNYVSTRALNAYRKLYSKSISKWINCENQIEEISGFTWKNWLERLYFERLNQKSFLTEEILKQSNNNWEATLFAVLAKGFGGNINGEFFLKIAQSIPFQIIQKTNNSFQLEALLFGQANLLNKNLDDEYYQLLSKEYDYLKHKYKLSSQVGLQVHFFKLRPPNFPTIRLSQLAKLYTSYSNIFNELIVEDSIIKIFKILSVNTLEYWHTHYNFGKETSKKSKKVSTVFIELLIINSILPLKLLYQKSIDKFDADSLLKLIKNLKVEKNSIITNYKKLGVPIENAMDSQALLTLKKSYCEKKVCLQCQIGYQILNSVK